MPKIDREAQDVIDELRDAMKAELKFHEQLKAESLCLDKEIDKLTLRIVALEAENARLQKGLEYYADQRKFVTGPGPHNYEKCWHWNNLQYNNPADFARSILEAKL